MDGENNKILVPIGSEEIKGFSQIFRKITETNMFPYVLSENGFTKINESLFKKRDNQLIRIFQQDGKWLYQNLKNISDNGSLIQFLANRLNTDEPMIVKDPAQLFLASNIAKTYHKEYIKSLRVDYFAKLLQQPAIVNNRRHL